MSVRRTLLAALILAVLAPLAWLDSTRVESRSMAEFAERTLLGMGLEDIASFTLDNSHGHFALERRGETGWWLTEPEELFADQQRVFVILSNMADAKRFGAQGNIPSERLGDYGLSDPPIRATFQADDGRTVSISFGDESPGLQRFFAHEEGTDEIFTVTTHVLGNLEKSLLQLRDRRVFPELPQGALTAIEVSAEGRFTRLEPDDAGQIWITAPHRQLADAELGATVLQALTTLEATGFYASGDSQVRGFDPPIISVGLVTSTGESLLIDIGMPRDVRGDNFYAHVPGTDEFITIAGRTVAQIPLRWIQWLDRDLMHLSPEQVGRFSLTVPDIQRIHNLAFERNTESGEWQLATDPTARVNQTAVNSLLGLFSRLVADEVLTAEGTSPEMFGLERPLMVIAWHSIDGTVSERLDHGSALGMSSNQAYYRRDPDGPVYVAPACYTDAQVLRQQLLDRRAVVADLTTANRIVHQAGDTVFIYELRGGEWSLLAPDGTPERTVSTQRVHLALERLSRIQYDQSLQGEAANAVRQRLADPAWSITVQDEDGETLVDVRAGIIPSEAEAERPIFLLLDGERACVTDRDMLMDVQRGLDQILRH